MPTDIIVALTLTPYIVDQSTMCKTCVHADEVAGEIFQEINQSLNGPLAMKDIILSVRCTKAWPIKKEGQLAMVGYQMEHSIVQEYPCLMI